MIALIAANIIAVVLETMASLANELGAFFRIFEIISIIIFTAEYLLRIWVATENSKFQNPIMGRIRQALTPMAIVDLLAILPFYLPIMGIVDLRFIRILRLFRIFRVFKMGRYYDSFRVLAKVIIDKKEELLLSSFVVFVLLLVSSSIMYYIEKTYQPEVFTSIPASMWWGVATLTTVGYGDVYPITSIGKLLGALISILGIGIFALPAGIIASGLVERIQQTKNVIKKCPHCGRDIMP